MMGFPSHGKRLDLRVAWMTVTVPSPVGNVKIVSPITDPQIQCFIFSISIDQNRLISFEQSEQNQNSKRTRISKFGEFCRTDRNKTYVAFWLVQLTSNVYSQQKKDRRKLAEIQRDLNFCPSISIRYLLYQPLHETQGLPFSRQRKNPKEFKE